MHDGTVGNSSIEYAIQQFDSQYRLNFSQLIKESKMNTHKCQYLCYEKNGDLKQAEECARNCFKPLLYAKKNISFLIENKKEEFEKCISQSQIKNKENWVVAAQAKKCLDNYMQNMFSIKEEIEYIYKGYMKNYETLLKDNKV